MEEENIFTDLTVSITINDEIETELHMETKNK